MSLAWAVGWGQGGSGGSPRLVSWPHQPPLDATWQTGLGLKRPCDSNNTERSTDDGEMAGRRKAGIYVWGSGYMSFSDSKHIVHRIAKSLWLGI